MRTSSVLVVAALLAGCVHTHPVGSLERLARKQDRDWASDLENAPEDGRYWIHRTEALAVAVDAVKKFAPLVEVQPEAVRSDWVYSAETGIDEGGEWHSQERVRATADIPGQHEIGVELNQRTEARKLVAGLPPGGWAGSDTTWDVPEAMVELKKLESDHLARPRLEGEEPRFRRIAAELSPKAYAVTVDEPGRLMIERYVTEGKTSTNGKKTGSWHSRSQIELLITSGGVVDVQLRNEHRFDTDSTPGEWTPAESSDGQRAREWIKALLKDPRSGLILGEPAREAPSSVEQEVTPPPKVATLRTLPEIQQIIANRAIETSTGDFRICVVGALFPAANPAGGTWDPDPAAPEAGSGSVTGPKTPAEVLGEAVTDYRTVDGLSDIGKFEREIPIVEDFIAQANLTEHAARLETSMPGFTPLRLPSSPDVAGRLESGGKLPLPVIADRMVATWSETCHKKRYKNGLPILELELVDQEEEGPDEPMASCNLDLVTVLTKGDQGITCGDARVYMSATYLFDRPQIELVGLPPARE